MTRWLWISSVLVTFFASTAPLLAEAQSCNNGSVAGTYVVNGLFIDSSNLTKSLLGSITFDGVSG
jgi:hypothetical protein